MHRSFEYNTTLEYRLKAALATIDSFKSGEKYIKLKENFRKVIRSKNILIRRLKQELEQVHKDIIRIRNQWFEVCEDLQMEFEKKEKHHDKVTRQLLNRALRAERKLDNAHDMITEQRQKIYSMGAELETEKGKNLKLKEQLNRDYENSSTPSSKSIKNKKISNNRERTGRKPGGQPGHKGHSRKKQVPTTEPVLLPPPQDVLDNPDFKKTKKRL